MKSERRHELQENELAKGLGRLPEFTKRHGPKLLLTVVIVALAIVLIRNRIQSAHRATQMAYEGLAGARQAISQLENPQYTQAALQFPEMSEFIADERKRAVSVARDLIDQVTQASDDPAVLAEALLVTGDLNWAMATLPPVPGATTRPALGFERSPEESLDSAEAAYRQILEKYPKQTFAVTSARFGLAAIAEQRRDFNAAKEQYDAILAIPNVDTSLASLATQRLAVLNDFATPAYLATPASAPAVVGPTTTTVPTTAPATQPAP